MPSCEITLQQMGGNDGFASRGGELHHHSRIFWFERVLDLFQQVLLVVT